MHSKKVEGIGYVYDSEHDEDRNITWLAAGSFGLLTFNENAVDKITGYQPKGPLVNKAWDMQFNGNKLVVVPGGRWAAVEILKRCLKIWEQKLLLVYLKKQIM